VDNLVSTAGMRRRGRATATAKTIGVVENIPAPHLGATGYPQVFPRHVSMVAAG
jgi:hypothetical protein